MLPTNVKRRLLAFQRYNTIINPVINNDFMIYHSRISGKFYMYSLSNWFASLFVGHKISIYRKLDLIMSSPIHLWYATLTNA